MSLDVYLSIDVDTGGAEPKTIELFSANITHNLSAMASEAGIYEYVWRPDECEDVKCAGDLIEPLRRGIEAMKCEPDRFKALNPRNGWGTYTGFVSWLNDYLHQCEQNPRATIEVDR